MTIEPVESAVVLGELCLDAVETPVHDVESGSDGVTEVNHDREQFPGRWFFMHA